MKNLCCVVVLVLGIISCFYFPKIVNNDADLLDVGRITAIDEEAGTIKIWDGKDAFYKYEVPLKDAFLDEKLCIGDKVYVYFDEGSVYASTVFTEDAKAINLFLYEHFKENLINPWVIFIALLIPAIIMNLMVFDRKESFKYKYVALAFLVSLFLSLYMEPNYKLFYEGGGEVVKVLDDNKIVTDDGVMYPLCKNMDIITGDSVFEGDVVYLYRYGQFDMAEYKKLFVSTKMFDDKILKVSQIYPYIYIISMCILGIIFICWSGVWQFVKNLTKKEE